MTSAQIATATERDGVDRHLLEEIAEGNLKWAASRVPRLFADATVTVPAVDDWVRELVALAVRRSRRGDPVIRNGPSLLLAGKVGRGKTWQTIGALRALTVSGCWCEWEFVYEPDWFDAMRPRAGVDSEEVFERYAGADVLVLDDMGCEPRSDWVSTKLCRLIDRRNRDMLPTLITTNVPPGRFTETFGDRVTSRLVELCREVRIEGPDRRKDGVR